MQTMREIRRRVQSINNTKQITESMRLVATSKVQRAKRRLENNRPYFMQSINIIKSIVNNPLVLQSAYISGRKAQKPLVILITGDHGLCGGYNVNVSRKALDVIKEVGAQHIITIGAKGRDYCRRRKKQVLHGFRGLSERPFYEDAQVIGNMVIEMFDNNIVDEVFIVYTQYHSMLNQTPKSLRLLPLNEEVGVRGEEDLIGILSFEPGEESFLKSAVSTYISSMLFEAMLESAVCEQSARITGMDSAVKNSDKLIDSLNIQYNQMRQGAITQEIAEIVGGANAVQALRESI